MNKSIDQSLPLHVMFIHIKQACDKEKKEKKVYEAIKDMDINDKLTRLVKITLTDMSKRDFIKQMVTYGYERWKSTKKD